MRFLFVCIVLLVCPALGLADSHMPRVGFLLPLSGEWAFLGNGIRDGARLAQMDLANLGQGVNLVFEDNQGNLALSAQLASKLITIDKVDVLVSIISGVGTILKPLANQFKILHVGICSEPEVADGQYSFINYLTAEQGVAKFLEHFTAGYGSPRSLAIFSMNESGFQRIAEELKRKAKPTVLVTSEDNFDKGTSDFRSLILRAIGKKPDAALILGLSPEIELLARQLQATAPEVPITSIEGIGLASDKSAFEGSWFVDSGVPDREFRDRFLREFDREVTPGVGHSYDTIRMVAEVFRGARSRDEAIAKFRQLSGSPGVLGKLDVRPDGVIWSKASVKMIKNGKPVLLEAR